MPRASATPLLKADRLDQATMALRPTCRPGQFRPNAGARANAESWGTRFWLGAEAPDTNRRELYKTPCAMARRPTTLVACPVVPPPSDISTPDPRTKIRLRSWQRS